MRAREVSVVVAAYNEERWIDACLSSLKAQTHPSYDLLVVDDGSTDRTPDIAARHDVRVLRTDHVGAGAARDAGGRATSGEVIVFLDGDEMYAPDFLERLVAPLADPEVTGTFPGGCVWHNLDDGLARGWLFVRGLPDPEPIFKYPDTFDFPKAVRRRDFERLGGYPHVGYGEDQAFGWRMGRALVVPDAWFAFTLPTSPIEIFKKARWIGRGPRFARERPALRELLPLGSWTRAARLLAKRRARDAAARVVYDAGLVVGFAESKVFPARRNVA